MKNVVIVGAKRTAIGDYLGALKSKSVTDLGVIAAVAAMEQAGIQPNVVEEVACGNCNKTGQKASPGRQIQIKAGCPVEGFGYTIDQQCSSGMKATDMIYQSILTGNAEIGLAVGSECMSQAPYMLKGAREGYRMGNGVLQDTMLDDGLVCAMMGYHMGITAENVAERYGISREAQDEQAYLSHSRAVKAIQDGVFKSQIVPVPIKTRKGEVLFDTDEHPRADISVEKLAAMKPAFKKDGSVTAGNASGLNDGASAMVLMSDNKAKELGCKPMARIVAISSAGVEPAYMGIGPIYAVPKVLKKAGLELKDIDYFEINEAFAAQYLACERELKIDPAKVNHNGSGIGLGHPVGCTANRIIMALIYELERTGGRYGLASLCVGGGPAMAAIIEKL